MPGIQQYLKTIAKERPAIELRKEFNTAANTLNNHLQRVTAYEKRHKGETIVKPWKNLEIVKSKGFGSHLVHDYQVKITTPTGEKMNYSFDEVKGQVVGKFDDIGGKKGTKRTEFVMSVEEFNEQIVKCFIDDSPVPAKN